MNNRDAIGQGDHMEIGLQPCNINDLKCLKIEHIIDEYTQNDCEHNSQTNLEIVHIWDIL